MTIYMCTNLPVTHQRQGATTVELAVVLPVFLLVIFAFFELGHALMIDSIAENAAYEGARRGVVPGATQETAQKAAEDIATASSLRAANVEVETVTLNSRVSGIRVTVNAPMSENGIFLGSFFGNKTVSRSATMIFESNLRYAFVPSQATFPEPTPRPRGRGR
jgi:Flp pilus assembly protein TadG